MSPAYKLPERASVRVGKGGGGYNGSLLKWGDEGARRGAERRRGRLLFWSVLALGVTLQLLSLLSLAGWLKRTSEEEKEEGRWLTEEEEEERNVGGKVDSRGEERAPTSQGKKTQ